MENKPKKKFSILKLILYIIIIYLLIILFKLYVIVTDTFGTYYNNPENYSITTTFQKQEKTFINYVKEEIIKSGNIFIKREYDMDILQENPVKITYIDFEKRSIDILNYSTEHRKYIVSDGLYGLKKDEKDELLNKYKSGEPLKEACMLPTTVDKVLLEAVNPCVIVNPFSNKKIVIIPFDKTYRYVYDEYNQLSEYTIIDKKNGNQVLQMEYDYDQTHFNNYKIENPLGRYKGDITFDENYWEVEYYNTVY